MNSEIRDPNFAAHREEMAAHIMRRMREKGHAHVDTVYVQLGKVSLFVTVIYSGKVSNAHCADISTVVNELTSREDGSWRQFTRPETCTQSHISRTEFQQALQRIVKENQEDLRVALHADALQFGVRDLITKQYGGSPVVRAQLGDRQHAVHIEFPWGEVMEVTIPRRQRP